jgi:predicted ATPase/DNA-binding winged helix-turn-helix (wHTH) protein
MGLGHEMLCTPRLRIGRPELCDADGQETMAGETISFGPFRLRAPERLLTRDNMPIEIGGRALDILIALTDRAGQVLSKRELMKFVWPDALVDEASLRMHITALRRVLGDGQYGTRYIINVPGRGYSFVAPTLRSVAADASVHSTDAVRPQGLPPFPPLLVGRKQTIDALSSLLLSRRFASVIGPGGIGKTTVAVAVAHWLCQEFGDDAVFFVDLGSIADPASVPGTVASAIGCVGQGVGPEQSILAFLSGRRSLIVLDSCEHVIEAAATLAARLFREAPSLNLLTTSREALRIEGENVHLLLPLESPRADKPSAAEALASPAVQLFMERAAASGYEAELTDADAPIVAGICRTLDGIALAIELAASRVGVYGIQGTADLLNDSAGMMLQGRRSALPRHQTLQATFDWSFKLLSEYEQRLFSRLSVFVGQFTLEAARCIGAETNGEAERVSNALVRLVEKSLISISSASGPAYFRLLDMTRAYAATRLLERGEEEAIASRHASYFAKFLEPPRSEDGVLDDRNPTAYALHMGNIRKAIAWSLSQSGDSSIAVELVSRAAPLFLQLSLFSECQDYCQRALEPLRESDCGTRCELELREALAISSMWTRGISEEVRTAIERGLELSEALQDWRRHIRFLSGLNIFLIRLGDFGGSLAAAKRSAAVARAAGYAAEKVIAEWMLGASYHFAGDQLAALRHCERGFQLELNAAPVQVNIFGFDHRVRALVGLARSLWLRGLPDQARKVAHQTIYEATEHEQPISECIALLYTIPVFLWCGDFDQAALPIDVAIAKAGKYSLAPYHALGLALKGELMVAEGNAAAGVEILRQALKTLRAHHHHIVTPSVACALAEGLARCGQVQEAQATIEEIRAHVEEARGIFWLPDLLRVRGEILLASPEPDLAAAEDALVSSIDSARRQSAPSWELKAAIPLAQMWLRQGRGSQARNMLEEIYRRFTEGFEARDQVKARQLLEELGDASRPSEE